MTIQSFLKKPVSAGLIWGTIGGISLILMTLISTNGLVQISPYPVILIAAILTTKYNRPQGNVFNQLFVTGLFAFVIMSLILYIYFHKSWLWLPLKLENFFLEPLMEIWIYYNNWNYEQYVTFLSC